MWHYPKTSFERKVHIDTIIRNLLSNSIKFTHARKSVHITITREDDMVLITVKDEGIGMPPEILDKLFSLNENVTQPGTNNEKGTGLGLTLCKELVNENRGDLRVTSEPGKGSEFVLCIPAFKYAKSSTVEKDLTSVS